MSRGRRQFIKRICAGTAGVALGGLTINAIPAGAFAFPRNGHARGDFPVFPFTGYAGRYNIGDYIPKDQGGKFIQMTLLGTEDDAGIVEAIRGGVLSRVYGEPVEWQRYERSEIEKSVWLNRFYFLPSFARMYHLTGDRSYLDDMMRIIRTWITDNPRMPDSHRTTYNWRDMQVAWRSIHFSWCYYLGDKGLTSEEKQLIVDSLREHAHILLTGFGQAKLNEFNHQSHGGLAMIYLGVLFPMLDDSTELLRRGMIILNHHLANAFYPDGGNVEQMFGYYPFQSHLFRDAFLLCTANGIEPPVNSLPMLRRMAHYLASVERPDGTVPQVNDSYEMPVRPILDTINDIPGAEAVSGPQGSVLFPDTQVAVMRRGGEEGWYLLANPASVIGAHAHAGRLGFELWNGGMPLLIESGCCNYDDPALVSWYRTTRAHNSVVIDGMTEAATSSQLLWVPRRETPNRITEWNPNNELPSLTMVSPPGETTNAGVRWSRKITLVNRRMAIISDSFTAEGEHNYELLLHFPPSDVNVSTAGKEIIVNKVSGTGTPVASPAANVTSSPAGTGAVSPAGAVATYPTGSGAGSPAGIPPVAPATIHAIAPDSKGSFTVSTGLVSVRAVSTEAPMASFSFRAAGNTYSHLLVIAADERNGIPGVSTRTRKGVTAITVRDTGGTVTRIRISGDSVILT